MSDAVWMRAAAAGACPTGQLLGVEVGEDRIVIVNVDGTLYALEDQCSHADFALSQGSLEGSEVECTLHGARFDVCSGRATRLPAIRPVRSFGVEEREDGIYVRTE